MNFDNLTPQKFWDLVYKTAMNKKAKRKVWNALMSRDYARRVQVEAAEQMVRIDNDLDWYRKQNINDDAFKKKVKAYEFIKSIHDNATNRLDKYRNEDKVYQQYARMHDVLDYVEYLKDTIEDLIDYTGVPTQFDFSTDIDQFLQGTESSIDRWHSNRKKRKK